MALSFRVAKGDGFALLNLGTGNNSNAKGEGKERN